VRIFRTRRPSPALVISIVALLVALGGTAYAGITIPKNSVGTKQLKDGAVTTKKIKNGTVTASKINTSGLTVPRALQANSATTAGSATTATNATNATNAANAAVGDSPIAWARVAANGTVIAGRGITSSNVSEEFTSAYCFHGLGFAFQSAAVTPDYSTSNDGADIEGAQFALGDPFNDCATVTGTQAEVATFVNSSDAETGFFIQFFN
jgi:hypothetical protein